MEIDSIVLGMGCFWCPEAVFDRIKGVKKVEVGFAGGRRENPTYEQVVTGATGHAEVAKIEFNLDDISLSEILDIFWVAHDPTQKDGQGHDIGSQYRSMILYNSNDQKQIAEESKQKLESEKTYSEPIVTEIKELTGFYPAEDYHQDFYNKNRNFPYCRIVIDPKVAKARKRFTEKYIE